MLPFFLLKYDVVACLALLKRPLLDLFFFFATVSGCKHLFWRLLMKNLSWAVLGLLLCVPFAGAEVIDSVSFNPARLGRYETLKVSDQLTTKGGIEANAVTVQSGGTVSVNNAGNYKFPATEVKGSVEMTSTDFKADTLNSRGTASFENKRSSAESKISTLNTSTADVRANILDLTSVTVPTGGSLTLGENAIPEPTQSCSNLRWVERTADDNYKYKVLAFGSCAGGEAEEEECSTSYGNWMTAGLLTSDTCDKNSKTQFSCSKAPRGKKTTCVDVYQSSSSSSQVNTLYGTPSSAGTWDTDTCDGDKAESFMCSAGDVGKSCTDVYVQGSGSLGTESYIPNGTDPGADCSLPFNLVAGDLKSYIETHGINKFCSKLMAQNSPKTSCYGYVLWRNPPGGNGGYYRKYTCTGRAYKRTASCSQSSSTAKYRNITCCGDE